MAEFHRVGVACRRVDELTVPVEAWRAAMCHAARRHGTRVRTFLVPPGADGRSGQMVFAVRIDPPPTADAEQDGLLRRWRLDELGMPFHRWRSALHRVARREHARIHTFLLPLAAGADGVACADEQVVYLLWAAPDRTAPVLRTVAGPSPAGPERPVTILAGYAETRARRAAAIARHPSAGWAPEGGDPESGDTDDGDG